MKSIFFSFILTTTLCHLALSQSLECDHGTTLCHNSEFGTTLKTLKSKVESSFREIKHYKGGNMNDEQREMFKNQYKTINLKMHEILDNFANDMADRKYRKAYLKNPGIFDERYASPIQYIESVLAKNKADYLKIVPSSRAAFGLQEVTILIAIGKELYSLISDQIKIINTREQTFYKTCFSSHFANEYKLLDYDLL